MRVFEGWAARVRPNTPNTPSGHLPLLPVFWIEARQVFLFDLLRRALTTSLVFVALLCAACDGGWDRTSGHLTIGLITNNPNGLRNIQGFKDEMVNLGYEEGRNVTYIFSGTQTSKHQLDDTISAMLDAGVDLLFTAGTPTGVSAHRVTAGTSVPVVFGVIADPIAAGVIEDLNQPGGNLTGVKLAEAQARRLELFLDLIPGRRSILVPFNPEDAAAKSAVRQIERVAEALDVVLVMKEVRNDAEVSSLLTGFPENVDAVFLVPDSVVNQRLSDVMKVATERGIPVSGPSNAQAEGGALMAYGFMHTEAGAQAARIADQIIKGIAPGNIPVQTAEQFFTINLACARQIGLEIPEELVRRAHFVLRQSMSASQDVGRAM